MGCSGRTLKELPPVKKFCLSGLKWAAMGVLLRIIRQGQNCGEQVGCNGLQCE